MPGKKQAKKTSIFIRILAHKYFFWGVVVLFVAQALWIAFSALYPMLFDEELHVGIIEIYSRQISPFISHQPSEAAFHGDITRMGSYLFHYLMSFPYRLTSLFTDSLMAHVIVLRAICTLFVAGGLMMFNKVLRLAKISAAVRHLVILIFTLIPIVPFTAANVNYDNLVFLLIPSMLYMALKSVQKTHHQAIWVIATLSLGAFSCLVKFSVLPILLAIIIFVAINIWRQYGNHALRKLWNQIKMAPRWLNIAVILVALLAAGLFIERYGANVAVYHKFEPNCSQIHSKKECLQYNIYRRSYEWSHQYKENPHQLLNPAFYTFGYFIPHIFNDFFVTAAYTGGEVALRQPLGKLEASGGNLFLKVFGWATFVSGLLLVIITWRRVKYKQIRNLFLLTGIIYVVALWVTIYSSYRQLGTPVAAQGRYMIPLLIPALTLVVLALSQIIQQTKIKVAICALALLVLTQGGGVMTYILYSKPSWYWPNQTIIKTNQHARKVIKSFTL